MSSPTFDRLTDAQLDRLVDGEMPFADYRQLVQSLDRQPTEWRRVACAFLEAQAWRRDLATVVAPVPVPLQLEPKLKTDSWRRLALAAALLAVAFAAGTYLGSRGSHPSSSTLATNTSAIENNPMSDPPTFSHQALKPLPSGSMQIRMPATGSSAEQIVEVPIFEKDSVDLQELWSSGRHVNEYLAAAQERGDQVERKLELVPVALHDGREAIFPVERIRSVPVTLVTY